jgi:hypothetical protein
MAMTRTAHSPQAKLRTAERSIRAAQSRASLSGAMRVACVLAAVTFIGVRLALFLGHDISSARSERAVATVINVLPAQPTRGNPDVGNIVVIQMADVITDAHTYSPCYIGERLNVEYKRGPSGAIYVTRWAPVARGSK